MTYFGTQVNSHIFLLLISNRNDCWKVLPYLPRFARLKLGHQVREGLAVDLRGVRPLLAVVWYTSRVRPSTFRVAAAPRSINNNTTLTHLLVTLHASVLDCYGLCDCDTNTITLFYFWQFQLHSKLRATLHSFTLLSIHNDKTTHIQVCPDHLKLNWEQCHVKESHFFLITIRNNLFSLRYWMFYIKNVDQS